MGGATTTKRAMLWERKQFRIEASSRSSGDASLDKGNERWVCEVLVKVMTATDNQGRRAAMSIAVTLAI